MSRFVVLFEPYPDEEPDYQHIFRCEASDEQEAEALCEEQYPDMFLLDVMDESRWDGSGQ